MDMNTLRSGSLYHGTIDRTSFAWSKALAPAAFDCVATGLPWRWPRSTATDSIDVQVSRLAAAKLQYEGRGQPGQPPR